MAGDADNINNQARKMRTNYLAQLPRAGHNWVNDLKNKQAANGLLASAPVRSGGCPRRLALRTGGPLHPSRTDHVVLTHNSLLFLSCGIACHVRPRCVLVWYRFVLRERFLAIPNNFVFVLPRHQQCKSSGTEAHLERTWSAVISLTSRAGELRSAPSGPDDRDRVTG